MRELSIIELELIIGGYDSGGGGGDYVETYGDSSVTVGSDDNYTGNIAAGDEQGITDTITAQGIRIEDISIPIKVGPVSATIKIPGSKKKK